MWKFPVPSEREPASQTAHQGSQAKLVTAFGQPQRITPAAKPDPRFAPKLAQWRVK